MATINLETPTFLEGTSESKSLTWKIPNFRDLVKDKASCNSISTTFEAGETLGCPTKWKCFLQQWGDEEGVTFIGIFTDLIENVTNTKPIHGKTVFTTYVEGEDTRLSYSEACLDNFTGDESKGSGHRKWLTLERILNDVQEKTLIIEIDFTMVTQKNTERNSAMNFQDLRKDGVKKLLFNSTLSDVTLAASDGDEIRGHKAILASHSPVFLSLFPNPNFKGRVDTDISSPALKHLLTLIYTGDMDKGWVDVKVCEDIVKAAVKYQISGFKEYVDSKWANFCNVENAERLHPLFVKYGMLYSTQRKIRDFMNSCSLDAKPGSRSPYRKLVGSGRMHPYPCRGILNKGTGWDEHMQLMERAAQEQRAWAAANPNRRSDRVTGRNGEEYWLHLLLRG